MRYRVTQVIEVEAESLVKATDLAEAPILAEIRKQSSRLAGIVSLDSIEVAKV